MSFRTHWGFPRPHADGGRRSCQEKKLQTSAEWILRGRRWLAARVSYRIDDVTRDKQMCDVTSADSLHPVQR